jgi:hypothetical protein
MPIALTNEHALDGACPLFPQVLRQEKSRSEPSKPRHPPKSGVTGCALARARVKRDRVPVKRSSPILRE